MDALTYPYELYLPKVQQWHRVGGQEPHDPDARFVYVDITAAPLSVLDGFKDLQGVWLRRAADAHMEALPRFSALSVVYLVEARITSLAPLRHLPKLQAISLADPPVLHGLEGLKNLRCLTMRHFRRINSLSAVAALPELRALSVSTIPSWDASRRCLQVESLEPLGKAVALESLALMGIWPQDARLEVLHGLANLRFLHISHVYGFSLEQYAALRRTLPDARGHCLEPYYLLPQLNLHCKRCAEELVFLTGPRPRTPRRLCPKCHAHKLEGHVRRWDAALQTAPGTEG
ncbi:MAG TPA: hypothetical protein VNM47_12225 [Terriglobia bacterium]|nr:hypothetical protein [Terriglobia bacterium]